MTFPSVRPPKNEPIAFRHGEERGNHPVAALQSSLRIVPRCSSKQSPRFILVRCPKASRQASASANPTCFVPSLHVATPALRLQL